MRLSVLDEPRSFCATKSGVHGVLFVVESFFIRIVDHHLFDDVQAALVIMELIS